MKHTLIVLSIMIVSLTIFQGCSVLSDLTSMKNVQFRVGSVASVSLGGISVSNKSKVTDFSVAETMSLASKVASKSLPLTMTVNLEARNPNAPTQEGSIGNAAATLQSFEWRLLIDDVPTIEGIITGPITIPAGGTSITIPITAEIDLFKFFESRGYTEMAKLAFALANPGLSTVSVKLDAKPVVQTFLGTLSYPGRITIIEKEFK
jgi:hypothetical protein